MLYTLSMIANNTIGKYEVNNDGCWIWQRSKQNQGYGMTTMDGKKMLAHRVSYIFAKGEIPDGKKLDHLCRTPACINPDHLEPVTQRENILRSPSSTCAVNHRKTHCKNGHEYTPENTFNRQRPGRHPERECLTCRKAIHLKASKRYYARKRSAQIREGLNWQGKPYKKLAYKYKITATIQAEPTKQQT